MDIPQRIGELVTVCMVVGIRENRWIIVRELAHDFIVLRMTHRGLSANKKPTPQGQ
jgi:hypothetical protein